MKYFSENNWSSWKYDEGPLFARSKTAEEKLIPVYKKLTRPVLSLNQEAESKKGTHSFECAVKN